jgi:putative SOS response-associated peptidase YedK
MCGRVVIVAPDLSVFVLPFGVRRNDVHEWLPRFNLAPTQLAPMITNEAERRLVLARFGLVPSWSHSERTSQKLINARAETAATRGAFRAALTARRCIIPVSGYFEWQKVRGAKKQALFIHDPSGKPLPLAGLWERWRSAEGQLVESFAVLTRASSGFLRDIHDRMPLEVPEAQLDLWLRPEAQTADELAPVLRAAPEAAVSRLVARPVSALVNSPHNDTPACLEPYDPEAAPPARQLDLFARPALTSGSDRERSG